MTTKTCAACDCELESEPISVTVGGSAVEVCCEDCARTLREAEASLPQNSRGRED
jgi:ribosome-binding protein aMBF1 (putative translation factor)